MKADKLPEPKFYTLQTLAEKWGCSESKVLNYALTGQLQLSIESQGWKIEYGSIEEDDEGRWFSIPEEIKHSRGDILQLSLRDQKDLVKNGEATDPSFKEEKYAYASALSDSHGNDVVIYLSEVIITPIDATTVFEGTEEDSTDEGMSSESSIFAEEQPLKLRTAVDSVPLFYKEGIKIYDRILKDTGKDPNLQTVMYKLHDMPEFKRFPLGTIKRHMNKKELILRYQKSKKG